MDEQETRHTKSWLFQENIRLDAESKALEEKQAQFAREKEQFQQEMKALNRKMEKDRQRLKQENAFFDQKMQILQNGFAQLDMDRRRLEREQARFEDRMEFMEEDYFGRQEVSLFFRGVHSLLSLKKRYKDLIKIFHPDNVAGDKEIIQAINAEYERLRAEYEMYMQA